MFTRSQTVPARPSGARVGWKHGEELEGEEGSTMESALLELCRGGKKLSVWGEF
jgi:hypothetical protein